MSGIERDGATVSSLSIREPTVADVEIADKEKSGLARMLRMLCAIADISPDTARALGTHDYARLQEFVGSIL